MPHYNDAILRIDDHIEDIMEAHDGRALTDHIVAELKYLADVICDLGEARDYVQTAHAGVKSKGYAKSGAVGGMTSNPGVRRGVSVK